MLFAHYYKTNDLIGEGSVVFRRYSQNPIEEKTRFGRFVEGTLGELLPEDFEGITVLPAQTLNDNILEDNTVVDELSSVKMADTITTIGNESFSNKSLNYILFSSNIANIGYSVGNRMASGSILDFSNAKRIPTLEVDQNGNYTTFAGDNIVSIKVPAALYLSWKAATGWSVVADKIVSA